MPRFTDHNGLVVTTDSADAAERFEPSGHPRQQVLVGVHRERRVHLPEAPRLWCRRAGGDGSDAGMCRKLWKQIRLSCMRRTMRSNSWLTDSGSPKVLRG
jgi:hypothetical protein